MVFVCEELCNLSFEKRSLNQDNNNYRTKTLNRSVHYPSLHCRTIHHRWEFFLYVSCRWEKKKNTIIVTFSAEMMKNEGPVQHLQRGLFLGPLHRWQNIFLCIYLLKTVVVFSLNMCLCWHDSFQQHLTETMTQWQSHQASIILSLCFINTLICFWTIILVYCLHIRNKPFIQSIM